MNGVAKMINNGNTETKTHNSNITFVHDPSKKNFIKKVKLVEVLGVVHAQTMDG